MLYPRRSTRLLEREQPVVPAVKPKVTGYLEDQYDTLEKNEKYIQAVKEDRIKQNNKKAAIALRRKKDIDASLRDERSIFQPCIDKEDEQFQTQEEIDQIEELADELTEAKRNYKDRMDQKYEDEDEDNNQEQRREHIDILQTNYEIQRQKLPVLQAKNEQLKNTISQLELEAIVKYQALHKIENEDIDNMHELYSRAVADYETLMVQKAQIEFHKRQKPQPLSRILHQQGAPGFNEEVRTKIIQPLVTTVNFACSEPKQRQIYQKITEKLITEARCRRLLVVHRVGSGKTAQIIGLLDIFYNDPKTKVVIFPEKSQLNQTLTEMLIVSKWGNNSLGKAFRDQHKYADNDDRFNNPLMMPKILDAFKLALAKGVKDGISPVIFNTYRLMGGAMTKKNNTPGWGRRTFKRDSAPVGFKCREGAQFNPMDNKIVIMDEFHNLIRPTEENVKYIGMLEGMRKDLEGARDIDVSGTMSQCNLYGFTGTPTSSGKQNELGELLEFIRDGRVTKSSLKNFEGFLSYFNLNPMEIFPQVRDMEGLPEMNMPKEISVTIKDRDHVKKIIDTIKKTGGKAKDDPSKFTVVRAWPGTPAALMKQQSNITMDFAKMHAPKLAAVVDFIKADKRPNVKTLVMMNGKHALELMSRLLQYELKLTLVKTAENQTRCGNPQKCMAQFYQNMEFAETIKDNFNKDKKGMQYRVALADSNTFGEGFDVHGIRQFIMIDVPKNAGQYTQWMGRFLRLCSQVKSEDPTEDNLVDCRVVVATLGNGTQTIDEKRMKELEQYLKVIIKLDESIREMSIEGNLVYDMIPHEQQYTDFEDCLEMTSSYTKCGSLPIESDDEEKNDLLHRCRKVCKSRLVAWLFLSYISPPIEKWPVFEGVIIELKMMDGHSLRFTGKTKISWMEYLKSYFNTRPKKDAQTNIKEYIQKNIKDYTWQQTYGDTSTTCRFEDVEHGISYWNTQYTNFDIIISLTFNQTNVDVTMQNEMTADGWTVVAQPDYQNTMREVDHVASMRERGQPRIYQEIHIGNPVAATDDIKRAFTEADLYDQKKAGYDVVQICVLDRTKKEFCSMTEYKLVRSADTKWRCTRSFISTCPDDGEFLNPERFKTTENPRYPVRTFTASLESIITDIQDARGDTPHPTYIACIRYPTYRRCGRGTCVNRDKTSMVEKEGTDWKENFNQTTKITTHYKWL